MPITYEPIATQTLGSAAASITFSSIPGTYTDLRLVFVGTLSSGNATTGWRANSDSATNYSETYIGGDGTSAFSGRNTNSTFGFAGVTDTNQSMTTVDVFSYAGSTYKTALSDSVPVAQYVLRRVQLWRSTAAITSFTYLTTSGTFTAGTTATLYGIKNA